MSYTVRITKVKKMFNQEKVQITTDVLNMIDQKIAFKLRLMVKKCKDHNIKRLNEEVYPYVERML